MGFWGREHESAQLKSLNLKLKSRLAVLYGRRRIGKTYFIEETSKNWLPLLKFEGLEEASAKEQLQNVFSTLYQFFKVPPQSQSKDLTWDGFFQELSRLLEGKKILVFFDEFQWLAQMQSPFVSLFKKAWDNLLIHHAGCLFVLCGSVSSFIVKKVIRSKALYGRIDLELNLQPLAVADIRNFFRDTTALQFKSVLDHYLVLGGVPRYYEIINTQWSLTQNLNQFFFQSQSFFVNEYHRLLISHFGKNETYSTLLLALSTGPKTADELATLCKRKSGGSFSGLIEDLTLAGFVHKWIPAGKEPQSKQVQYKIGDEYLHFYFTFIRPNLSKIESGNFHFTFDPHKFSIWQGLAFERLCLKQHHRIAKALEFSGINYQCGPWFKRSSEKTGAQVDLMYIRDDRVITACEVKAVQRLKMREWESALQKKISVLQEAFPRYSFQKVLILADSEVELPESHAGFDVILRAEDFLLQIR